MLYRILLSVMMTLLLKVPARSFERETNFVKMYAWQEGTRVHTQAVKRSPVWYTLSAGEDVWLTGNKGQKAFRVKYGKQCIRDIYAEIINWEGKKGWVHKAALKQPVPAQKTGYINMPILNKDFIKKLLPGYSIESMNTNQALFVPLEDFDLCFPHPGTVSGQSYAFKDSFYYVVNFPKSSKNEPVRHPFFVFQKKEISELSIKFKVSAALYFVYPDKPGVWNSRDILPQESAWQDVMEKGSLMYVFSETLAHHPLINFVPASVFKQAEQEKRKIWLKSNPEETTNAQSYSDSMAYFTEIRDLQMHISWKDVQGVSKEKAVTFYYQHVR